MPNLYDYGLKGISLKEALKRLKITGIKTEEMPDNTGEPHKNFVTNTFNCWGFVAKAQGFRDTLLWEADYVHLKDLREKTKKVSRPKHGDIAVYGCGGGVNSKKFWLSHTAIILNGKTKDVIGKDGPCELMVCHVNDTGYGDVVEYRRVIA